MPKSPLRRVDMNVGDADKYLDPDAIERRVLQNQRIKDEIVDTQLNDMAKLALFHKIGFHGVCSLSKVLARVVMRLSKNGEVIVTDVCHFSINLNRIPRRGGVIEWWLDPLYKQAMSAYALSISFKNGEVHTQSKKFIP